MTLSQKLLFMFIGLWVSCEIFGMDRSDNLIFSGFMTLAFAYYFNAHGKSWKYLRNKFSF